MTDFLYVADMNENDLGQNQYDQLCVRVNALERRNTQLKESNELLTHQNCTLEDQVNDLIKARESFEKQINELKQYYQRKLEEKDAEIEALNSKLDTILQSGQRNEQVLQCARHERCAIEEQFMELRDKCMELEICLKTAQNMEDLLQERMKKMCQQMKIEMERNAEVISMYKAAEEKIAKLECRLEGLNDELDTVTKDLVKKDEENAHLRQIWEYMEEQPMNKWDNESKEWDDSADEAIVDCHSFTEEFSPCLRANTSSNSCHTCPKTSTGIRLRRNRRRGISLHRKTRKRRSLLAELQREHPALIHSLPSWNFNLPFDIYGYTPSEASFRGSRELILDDTELSALDKVTNCNNNESNTEALLDDKNIVGDELAISPSLFSRLTARLRRFLFMDIFMLMKIWLFCFKLPFRVIFLILGYMTVMRMPFIRR